MPPPPLHPSLPARPTTTTIPSGNFNAPLRATASSGGYGQQQSQGMAAAGRKSREATPSLHLPPHPNGGTRPPAMGGSPRLGGGGGGGGGPSFASSNLPGSPLAGPVGGGAPSPKPGLAGGTGGGTAGDNDPFGAVPPRLKPEDLRPSMALVELGEGWKVHWRAWKGPALLFSPSSSSNSASTTTPLDPASLYDYDPFLPSPYAPSPFPHLVSRPPLASSLSASASAASPALNVSLSAAPTPTTTTDAAGTPSSSSAGAAAPPPAKKAKKAEGGKKSAFDELLAEEGGPSDGAAPAATKKKGRIPKAIREAQAAQAAAAAALVASSPSAVPAPAGLDLPSPSGLSVSTSSAAAPAAHPPLAQTTAAVEAGPSAARLVRDRLSSLPSTSTSDGVDPILSAQREIARLSASFAATGEHGGENGDRLGLFQWVKVAPVRIGGSGPKVDEKGKGKGKEKEGEKRELEEEEGKECTVEGEAEGRTLWVFVVERGWEAEDGGGGAEERKKVLDGMEFEGLEALGSGTLTHSLLFPALYPSTSSSSSSLPAVNPLSVSAKSYPSCLALSSQLFTIPSISQPFPAQTHLQAAYEAFREGVREVVLDEMVALSSSSSSNSEERAVKLGSSVVYLPPPPPPSFASLSLPSAAPSAVRCTLLPPSLNRSALVLQPSITEVAYTSLPPRGARRGTRVVLAPSGVKAVVRKELRELDEAEEQRLREEWAAHLPPRAEEEEGEENEDGWVLCTFDLPASPKGKEKADRPVEVVWPRSLLLVDRSAARRSASASRSRSRSRGRAEQTAEATSHADDSSSSPESTPETAATSLPPSPAPFSYPSPLSPARTPLRAPYDAALRRRLASQALQNVTGGGGGGRHRRQRSRSTAGEAMDEDGAVGDDEGYRDPVKRRTGEVWKWMGEEVKRREDEVEREKEREREREREKERAAAEEKEAKAQSVSPEKKARQVPPAPPPLPASTPQQQQQQPPGPLPPVSGPAAPINMRTPMSLGTASTEAPSPAELFSSLGYGAVSAAGGYHPPPVASSSSSTAPHSAQVQMQMDANDLLSGLGVYPSPAEALPLAPTSSAPPVTAGMSTLDAAFSAFDWGDGTFGAGNASSTVGAGGSGDGGGGMGGGADFDDGLMLGLTDADFSFFDAPAPNPAASLPMSMPFDLSGLHDPAHDPHANPLDAFSVSLAPAASTSPSSVAPFSFSAPFDNALGLSASAPPPPVPTVMPVSAATPPPPSSATQHFPPLPPYSPSILSLPTFASASAPAFPFLPPTPGPTAPLSVSLSPSFARTSHLSSSSAGFSACSFDSILFGPSHAKADEKYDPRKGKFGLPSPDSDDGTGGDGGEQDFLALLPAAAGRRKGEGKKEDGTKESWFTAVCDPRLAMAERLRLARRKSAASKTSDKLVKNVVVRSRGWIRPHRTSKAILALPPPPFGGEEGDTAMGHNSADEAEKSEEEESSSEGGGASSGAEDEMDVDGQDGGGKDGVRRRRSKSDERLSDTFSSALLLLGQSLKGVLQRTLPPPTSQESEEDKPAAAPVIDQAKEVMLAILAEQVIYNAEFREATGAMLPVKETGDSLVPSRAISLASSLLSRTCTSLSPSSLFSEDTSLPPFILADSPAFLLRTQQCVVQTSAPAVSFWRPMGFEPLTGGKDVTAFVVYEDDGAEMHETVKAWLRSLSDVYQSLRLGEHALGTVAATGSFSGVQDGLVPLPAGLLTEAHGRDELKLLYATLAEHSKTTQNTVVYILSPFADSPLSPASPIAGILHQINKSRSPLVNMQPFPVALDSVAPYRPSLPQTSSVERLASVAFSVYDQLQIPVGRLRIPAPETFPTARPAPLNALGPAVRLFQAPAVTLSPSPSKAPQVQFSLSWPASTLEVEHRHRFLHICYGSKPVVAGDSSQEWLAVTQIDDKGETWRTIPRYLKIPANVVPDVHRVRVVWSFTKALVDATDVEWRVVVCKLGEPSAVEAKAWDSLLKEHLAISKRPLHVTFACVDFAPAFAVSPTPAPSRRGSGTSTISEEGELSLAVASKPVQQPSGKVSVFDTQPSAFTFTPAEPVSLVSFPALAPATTYFIHVPRIPTLTHSRVDFFHPSSPSSAAEPVSVHALHFLLSHASRTSAYTGTLDDLVADVRQNMTELAALGQARWGTSGRLSWHIEAARQALETATDFGEAAVRHAFASG